MGIVSEDGTVVGSIDVNQLDEIEPKTDEAKAQIDALKADVQAGQQGIPDDGRDVRGASIGEPAPAEQVSAETTPAEQASTEQAPAEQNPAEQAPAEQTSQPEQPSGLAGRRQRNQPQGG